MSTPDYALNVDDAMLNNFTSKSGLAGYEKLSVRFVFIESKNDDFIDNINHFKTQYDNIPLLNRLTFGLNEDPLGRKIPFDTKITKSQLDYIGTLTTYFKEAKNYVNFNIESKVKGNMKLEMEQEKLKNLN